MEDGNKEESDGGVQLGHWGNGATPEDGGESDTDDDDEAPLQDDRLPEHVQHVLDVLTSEGCFDHFWSEAVHRALEPPNAVSNTAGLPPPSAASSSSTSTTFSTTTGEQSDDDDGEDTSIIVYFLPHGQQPGRFFFINAGIHSRRVQRVQSVGVALEVGHQHTALMAPPHIGISIGTSSSSPIWNEGQRTLFDSLVRLYKPDNTRPGMVLQGPAGTGKSFVLHCFTTFARHD